MEKRPSWIQSVTSQFHFDFGGKAVGPAWFLLLSFGLLLCIVGDHIWRCAGIMVMLSALPSMVQETRRCHGTPLPKFGWWILLQDLILMASGGLLAVNGAMAGWKNVNFAIGVISFVVFLGLFLFRTVLYTDEKRKR